MQRILIRHLSGSKARQTDLFELPIKEFTLGRNASCDVRFDPELDDVVSRIHAKIVQEPGSPPIFNLVDLNSRNGTFLNGVRVASPAVINLDDHVRLGENGPEFVFEIDPRPKDAAKATRIAEPRMLDLLKERNESPFEAATRTQAQQSTGTRRVLLSLAVVSLLLLAALWTHRSETVTSPAEPTPPVPAPQSAAAKEPEPRTVSAADIARDYGPATVSVLSRWKLVALPEGHILHQVVACTAFRAHRCANARLPWYTRSGDRVEPYLAIDRHNRKRELAAIGGSQRGTGFVVGQEGLILTSRQLAANWDEPYFATTPPLPGYLIPCETRCDPRQAVLWKPGDTRLAAAEKSVRQWVPSRTSQVDGKPVRGKDLEGRHTVLEVNFPKTRTHIPAQLARLSARADLALLKIDLPQPLKTVTPVADSPAQAGESITLLSFPPDSPDMAGWTPEADTSQGAVTLPDPTLSAGIIARVLGAPDPSLAGEPHPAYQLELGSSSLAHAGGPVFNDRGQVIGVFSQASAAPSAGPLKLAVPIHYGLELLDPTAGVH